MEKKSFMVRLSEGLSRILGIGLHPEQVKPVVGARTGVPGQVVVEVTTAPDFEKQAAEFANGERDVELAPTPTLEVKVEAKPEPKPAAMPEKPLLLTDPIRRVGPHGLVDLRDIPPHVAAPAIQADAEAPQANTVEVRILTADIDDQVEELQRVKLAPIVETIVEKSAPAVAEDAPAKTPRPRNRKQPAAKPEGADLAPAPKKTRKPATKKTVVKVENEAPAPKPRTSRAKKAKTDSEPEGKTAKAAKAAVAAKATKARARSKTPEQKLEDEARARKSKDVEGASVVTAAVAAILATELPEVSDFNPSPVPSGYEADAR